MILNKWQKSPIIETCICCNSAKNESSSGVLPREVSMCQHSKIVVWYQVAGQKVVLGESVSEGGQDVISIWLSVPEEENQGNSLGYRMSLFDDGGREIANKAVSMVTADEFLARINVRA